VRAPRGIRHRDEHTAMKKVANRPLFRVVRVAPGTEYRRVEGNRRASRNGLVSDLPPEIPNVTMRNFCIAVRRGVCTRKENGATACLEAVCTLPTIASPWGPNKAPGSRGLRFGEGERGELAPACWCAAADSG
jgi:hypothetical protein